MVNIVAVALLALGVGSNFVRQSAAARDPGHRVAPVLTAILLCVGLALALAPVRIHPRHNISIARSSNRLRSETEDAHLFGCSEWRTEQVGVMVAGSE